MCGITGFIDASRQFKPKELSRCVAKMSDQLLHRGPDGSGVWTDPELGIALGHRRLSIIDLSDMGSQPMISADGRFVLTYNGEIYNHKTLRQELEQEGCRFRGHSDTEVLLEAIARWGLEPTLERLNGMFAFAVWDRTDRRLSLVRDRVGIKPLYYGWAGTTFLFGSELSALREHPDFTGEIDRDSLALFLENGYVPSPCCIYRNVEKLRPGQLLEIAPPFTWETTSVRSYWSFRDVAATAAEHGRTLSPTARMQQMQELLTDSVKSRLMADVPVGAFLSGGIDSSVVVSVAANEGGVPLRTFTIGFEEPEFDESRAATATARHLGVEHILHIVTPTEAMQVIESIPEVFDEPFADPSQIPTYLVSKLAREHAVVCLSGDGGDELLGGYDRYSHLDNIRRKIARFPRRLRKPMGGLYDVLRNRLLRGRTESGLIARVTAAANDCELYSILHRHWDQGSLAVLDGNANRTHFRPTDLWTDFGSYFESMMAYDTQTYLPDDVLCKVDRASMAHGLEVRVPLLDHRIVEHAWTFPLDEKVEGGTGKQPLRKLLAEFVPKSLFDRPKIGFGIPLGKWLRGPLRDWAESLLDDNRLREEGWLQPEVVRKKWDEHLSEEFDWQYLLWNVLMFQTWLERTTTPNESSRVSEYET
jgi:asparagine synthase (glutamine-hydrolysing)